MPRLYNLKDKIAFPATAQRIDRSSPWGNPFFIGIDGSRAEVCRLFDAYARWRLKVQPDWLEPLRGKDLICWCAPEQCHGETILRLLDKKGRGT